MKTFALSVFTAFIFICPVFAQSAYEQELARKSDSLVQLYGNPGGPGIAVSVVREGKIIYKNQTGYANLEYAVPISDSTVFHIASVSKQFTALSALLLEEEGKLSLDDDISKYLPELSGLPQKITIRQLANHTHGLANTYELAQLIGVSPQDMMGHAQMVKILLRQKQLNFVPGSQYQYNNTGFALLAEIIERVSGQSFAAFTRERIFGPLGMKHSLFLDDAGAIVRNKAYSYKKTKAGFKKIPFNFMVVGASGLNTTPDDLSRWAMNFDEPIVGNAQLFEKMKAPGILNSGQRIPYSLGQEVKMYRGEEVIFHGGGDAGYRAYLVRIPKYKFSVIVMGNLESFNPLDVSYALIDLYLGKFLAEPEKVTPPVYTQKDLKKFEGTYELFPGMFFSLVTKADTLYYQPFRSEMTLKLPVTADSTFDFPYAPHSRMVFDKQGMKWHFSDFAYVCQKVHPAPPALTPAELRHFEGLYRDGISGASYQLILKDKQLVASHPLNGEITLYPLTRDELYSDQSYFGRLKFSRNGGRVTGFKLTGQNLKDVQFSKIQ